MVDEGVIKELLLIHFDIKKILSDAMARSQRSGYQSPFGGVMIITIEEFRMIQSDLAMLEGITGLLAKPQEKKE